MHLKEINCKSSGEGTLEEAGKNCELIFFAILDLVKVVHKLVHCAAEGDPSGCWWFLRNVHNQDSELDFTAPYRCVAVLFAGASTFAGRGCITAISRDGRWTFEKVR